MSISHLDIKGMNLSSYVRLYTVDDYVVKEYNLYQICLQQKSAFQSTSARKQTRTQATKVSKYLLPSATPS